ncbi:MAG: hypothetical protein HFE86_08895 [Clostridiales bacterium]|nr:hypothetical protein [Clostridiales bacterium]
MQEFALSLSFSFFVWLGEGFRARCAYMEYSISFSRGATYFSLRKEKYAKDAPPGNPADFL